jgi:hypothetical protein
MDCFKSQKSQKFYLILYEKARKFKKNRGKILATSSNFLGVFDYFGSWHGLKSGSI